MESIDLTSSEGIRHKDLDPLISIKEVFSKVVVLIIRILFYKEFSLIKTSSFLRVLSLK